MVPDTWVSALKTPAVLRIPRFILLFESVCSPWNASRPAVVISSPVSGSQYSEGEETSVRSTAIDNEGITRVEFRVDGVRADPSPVPQSQATFSVVQSWKVTPGTHPVAVRAYKSFGAVSDPTAISVIVVSASAREHAHIVEPNEIERARCTAAALSEH